jgi:hypothetical protein
MSTASLKVTHWPYGLKLETLHGGGLLLRPARKARNGWGKGFRGPKEANDLAGVRTIQNKFDATEWEW